MEKRCGATCFECGREAGNFHHVVPFSKGGRRTIALCLEHHGLVHEHSFSHRDAVLEGLDKARRRGIKLGRRREYTDAQMEDLVRLRKHGFSYAQVAIRVGLSKGQVCRLWKQVKKDEEQLRAEAEFKARQSQEVI